MAKLTLFEVSHLVMRDTPFVNREEAAIRLRMLDFSLSHFSNQNDKLSPEHKNHIFIVKLAKKLRTHIYENDEFDKYLNVSEYVILRQITD